MRFYYLVYNFIIKFKNLSLTLYSRLKELSQYYLLKFYNSALKMNKILLHHIKNYTTSISNLQFNHYLQNIYEKLKSKFLNLFFKFWNRNYSEPIVE